ncbi:flavin reductase family protein [Thermosipho atlanticus]|uniref:NADH-FMN oxidoreductase RutF, flavin reductase (DIM6/NTAB) family n=1 Tax=Thermosipho atlanticus DSM 15807 TaxID=1123380 RepID=A0A1M5SRD3_9BACT|nr:flavin reductase family protein [Thermosipho atlanticus]SHH41082.1 NADH-FMN oxidoreductase RutF, flavin reductase (DIM6/NTAB) family [Thermosipho atlanticus DSM 15807]
MDALGKLYSSVAVVSMNLNGKINGITVAWIVRVSIKPKLIVISIGKTRYSHELLNKVEYYGVSVLSCKQKEIAKIFGTYSGRNYDKFKNVEYTFSKRGLPIINGSVAYLECKIIDKFDVGDHTLFVGEVVDEKVLSNEKPLIYGEHKILEVLD